MVLGGRRCYGWSSVADHRAGCGGLQSISILRAEAAQGAACDSGGDCVIRVWIQALC